MAVSHNLEKGKQKGKRKAGASWISIASLPFTPFTFIFPIIRRNNRIPIATTDQAPKKSQRVEPITKGKTRERASALSSAVRSLMTFSLFEIDQNKKGKRGDIAARRSHHSIDIGYNGFSRFGKANEEDARKPFSFSY